MSVPRMEMEAGTPRYSSIHPSTDSHCIVRSSAESEQSSVSIRNTAAVAGEGHFSMIPTIGQCGQSAVSLADDMSGEVST